MHTRPAFRDAFRERRCLVPADGFFEWMDGPAPKQPVWIHPEDGRRPRVRRSLGALALGRTGSPLVSFTVLTTDAAPWIDFVHDRMPVILEGDARDDAWLDPDTSDPDDLRGVLRPRAEPLTSPSRCPGSSTAPGTNPRSA